MTLKPCRWIASVWSCLLLVAAFQQLAVAQVDDDALSRCTDNFTSIVLTKAATENVTRSRQDVALAVSDFVTNCLNIKVETRALRIMVPATGLYPLLQQRAAEFEKATGLRVALNSVPFYEMGAEAQQELVSQLSDFSDGWILDPSTTGELASLGGFVPLDAYIPEDSSIQWSDVSRFFRTISAIYDGKVVAIPFDGDLFLMYYRRDLFDRYGLRVPATWDEFVDLAQRMNGTDTDGDGHGDLWGVCFDNGTPVCKANFILVALMAPYLQYKGTSQGWLLDPDTMRPLVDNPAMARALQHYVDLFNVQAKNATCEASNRYFREGKCLMTINFGDEFKANALTRGGTSTLGVARLPGSTQVLDRRTNQLKSCTGPAVCPFAKQTRLANGTTAWVNYAPYSAFGGWSAAISSLASSQQRRRVYQFYSYIAQPNNSWHDVLDPNSGIDPSRRSQLETEGPNFQRWTAAGYEEAATRSYLTAVNEALESPNIVLDCRLQFVGLPYRLYYEFALHGLTWNRTANVTINSTMATMSAQVAVGLSSVGEPADVQKQYWKLLGYQPPPSEATPGDGGGISPGGIAAAVVVPTVMVLLGAALALLLWRRHQQRLHLLTGGVRAPGAGPGTTLLITDIQSSTALWELLPEDVMAKALEVHHAVIRRALVKHCGYESATEGDSFIAAFHTATEAVLCAVSIQQELVAAPWPPGLLYCTDCAAVAEVSVAPTAWHGVAMGMLMPRDQALYGGGGDGGDSDDLEAADWRMRRTLSGFISFVWRRRGGTGNGAAGGAAAAAALAAAAAASNADTSTPLPRPLSHVATENSLVTAQLLEELPATEVSLQIDKVATDGGGTSTPLGPSSALYPSGTLVSGPVAPFGRPSGGGGGGGMGSASKPASTYSTGARGRAAVARLMNGSLLPSLASPHSPHMAPQPLQPRALITYVCEAWQRLSVGGGDTSVRGGGAAAGGAAPVSVGELQSVASIKDSGALVTYESGGAGNGASTGGLMQQAPHSNSPFAMAAAVAAAAPVSQGSGTLPMAVSLPQRQISRGLSLRLTALGSGALGSGAAQPGGGAAGSGATGARVLTFRGLRVRVGLASGVLDAVDVTYNAAEARQHYGGAAMRLARAVNGAAAGGQVLLSDSTFAQQRQEQQRGRLAGVLWLHMGQHVLERELPPQQVYQAVGGGLAGRLALFPPLTVRSSLAAGVLDAPVGAAAVAFIHAVGAASLLAWDVAVARRALALFETELARQLARGPSGFGDGLGGGVAGAGGGYIVEATGGLVLAAFSDAGLAVSTCLETIAAMPTQPWPAALLENALCEELAVAGVDPDGKLSHRVLFRGLRVKAGLDFGPVRATINAATGRLAYRGRVMNRAARIANSATSGQVLCSRDLWQAAAASAAATRRAADSPENAAAIAAAQAAQAAAAAVVMPSPQPVAPRVAPSAPSASALGYNRSVRQAAAQAPAPSAVQEVAAPPVVPVAPWRPYSAMSMGRAVLRGLQEPVELLLVRIDEEEEDEAAAAAGAAAAGAAGCGSSGEATRERLLEGLQPGQGHVQLGQAGQQPGVVMMRMDTSDSGTGWAGAGGGGGGADTTGTGMGTATANGSRNSRLGTAAVGGGTGPVDGDGMPSRTSAQSAAGGAAAVGAGGAGGGGGGGAGGSAAVSGLMPAAPHTSRRLSVVLATGQQIAAVAAHCAAAGLGAGGGGGGGPGSSLSHMSTADLSMFATASLPVGDLPPLLAVGGIASATGMLPVAGAGGGVSLGLGMGAGSALLHQVQAVGSLGGGVRSGSALAQVATVGGSGAGGASGIMQHIDLPAPMQQP